MVDFTRMLDEMRSETPEQRQERMRAQEEQWANELRGRVDDLRARVKAASALPNPTPQEYRFLASLLVRSERSDPITRYLGGELLSLSPPQLGWLEALERRAQLPRPAPGSRAERYGRERG